MIQHTLLTICFLFPLSDALKVGPDDCKEKYCYDLDVEKLHRKHLGTKTAYPQYTDFDFNKEYVVPGKRKFILFDTFFILKI